MGNKPEEITAVCPICGFWPASVTHHWYEKGDPVKHTRRICYSCNSILRRPHKDPERYLMPSFKVQVWYVREVKVGKCPVSLAALVDDETCRGYREWVDVRLLADLRVAIASLADSVGLTIGQWIVQALQGAIDKEDGGSRGTVAGGCG